MNTFIDLAELAKRATGADRELDVLIGQTLDVKAHGDFGIRESLKIVDLAEMVRDADDQGNIWSKKLPRFTASIDAVMALAPADTERRAEFGTCDVGTAWAYIHLNGAAGEAVGECDEASNEVLALLSAMLNVLASLAGERLKAVRLKAASPPPDAHVPECD